MKLLILNLPNPRHRNVIRDAAGGFGISVPLTRFRLKGSGKPYLNPFLPYAAAVAEDADWDYEILDAQALELSETKIIKAVKKINPDIILTMISLPSIYQDKEILHNIKEEVGDIPIVGCGTVCSVMPKDVLYEGSIDFATNDIFPYVNSIGFLLRNYENTHIKKFPGFSYMENGDVINIPSKPCTKGFQDFIPTYEKLRLRDYGRFYNSEGKKRLILPILGSKGCHYPCSYCPYPIGFGGTIIFKQPKKVVDEIEQLNQDGFDYFLFRDRSFTTNRKWSIEVCKEIVDRNLEISWICEARVDESSSKILEEMVRSGCEKIHYGVETGDPTLIDTAKPGVILRKTRDTFKTAHELGIWRHAHLLLGLPGENKKTLEMTNKFVQDLDPDGVSINIATPYPGTKLFEIAAGNNWILTRNWKYYTSFDVVMKVPGLDPEDLYFAAKRIQKNFITRNRKEIRSKGYSLDTLKGLIFNYIQSLKCDFNYQKRFRAHSN